MLQTDGQARKKRDYSLSLSTHRQGVFFLDGHLFMTPLPPMIPSTCKRLVDLGPDAWASAGKGFPSLKAKNAGSSSLPRSRWNHQQLEST